MVAGGVYPPERGVQPSYFFSCNEKLPPLGGRNQNSFFHKNKIIKSLLWLLKAFKRLSKSLGGPFSAFGGVERPSLTHSRDFFSKRSQKYPPATKKYPPRGVQPSYFFQKRSKKKHPPQPNPPRGVFTPSSNLFGNL